MTDTELLEAAAKAAGISAAWVDAFGVMVPGTGVDSRWNPLTDDGDALRLAVALRIQIEWTNELAGVRRECYQASPKSLGHLAEFGLLGNDPCADIRRAIVRAAAAMVTR